ATLTGFGNGMGPFPWALPTAILFVPFGNFSDAHISLCGNYNTRLSYSSPAWTFQTRSQLSKSKLTTGSLMIGSRKIISHPVKLYLPTFDLLLHHAKTTSGATSNCSSSARSSVSLRINSFAIPSSSPRLLERILFTRL